MSRLHRAVRSGGLLIPLVALVLLQGCGSGSGDGASTDGVRSPDARASVVSGHVLERVASGLDGPRFMAFAPSDSALLIGSRGGTVWRLPAPYEEVRAFASVGNYPHSVAFRDGNLLIARRDGIWRMPYDPDGDHEARAWVPLPGGSGHASRTVSVGPNGRVHAALGISGNCSDQYMGPGYDFDDWRGGVLVLDETGSTPTWKPYATGLRNPVGLAWQPSTGQLHATNNGPDHHGFEEPPEYFVAVGAGDFFGMPWFQWIDGSLERDPCIDSEPPHPRSAVERPLATFPARNAPLGVAFAPAAAGDWAGDAFVALHGSWATRPDGDSTGPPESRRPPSIVRVHFGEDGRPTGEITEIVGGFQDAETGERWARPAGIAFGPDGALYFTSDHDDALYRVRPSRQSDG